MSVTLLASACPSVAYWTGLSKLADAYASSSGTGFGAKGVSQGESTNVRPKWNANALALDLTARYGGGPYCIANGLTFTCAGLVATVAVGQAVIQGITELPTATTANLTNNTRNYLWLNESVGGVGSLTVIAGSTTAPTNKSVFLGSVQVTSGTPGTVDTSGVVYERGGMRYRETADTGTPSDSPNTTTGLWSKTAGGLYLWAGGAWWGPLALA